MRILAIDKQGAKKDVSDIFEIPLCNIIAVAKYLPLKSYFFTVGQFAKYNTKDWEQLPQIKKDFRSWDIAIKEAKKLSKKYNKEVRLSTSQGYNNPGHYICEK